MVKDIAAAANIWRPSLAPGEALAHVAAQSHDENSEQFRVSLGRLLAKLGVHLERARRITDVREVAPVDVRAWVDAPLAGGRSPSLATRHNRRAAARLGFRLLREAGLVDHDPTVDIRLASRPRAREARPLRDAEVRVGRAASLRTLAETRRPALWALAEATATKHEIPRVLSSHVDLGAGTVELGGSAKIDARQATLTDWGVHAVGRRLEAVQTSDHPLVYSGSGRSAASMQAASSSTLTRILTDAGLRTDPTVKPGSIRAWAGLRVFEETGRIEQVALALGCRTLDTAAAIIGYTWRDLR